MVRHIKARIIEEYSKIDGEVMKMVIRDTVKKIGNSGYVSIPKELIGKYVMVIYSQSGNLNRKSSHSEQLKEKTK